MEISQCLLQATAQSPRMLVRFLLRIVILVCVSKGESWSQRAGWLLVKRKEGARGREISRIGSWGFGRGICSCDKKKLLFSQVNFMNIRQVRPQLKSSVKRLLVTL